MTPRPACMTDAELALWREANDVLVQVDRGSDSPCRDCQIRFAVEMRLEGRCNSWPAKSGRLFGWRKVPATA